LEGTDKNIAASSSKLDDEYTIYNQRAENYIGVCLQCGV